MAMKPRENFERLTKPTGPVAIEFAPDPKNLGPSGPGSNENPSAGDLPPCRPGAGSNFFFLLPGNTSEPASSKEP